MIQILDYCHFNGEINNSFAQSAHHRLVVSFPELAMCIQIKKGYNNIHRLGFDS